MIKAIIWDVGGVIGDYLSSPDSFWRDIPGSKQLRDEFGSSKMSTKEFIKKGMKMLDLNKKDFLKGYNTYVSVKLNKDVVKILKQIKIDQYILSDVSPLAYKQRLIDFKDILKLMKDVFWSTELKMRKSSIKTFQVVIKKIRKRPEEVVYIDDVEEHLERAKSLGINTILYKNPKQIKEALENLGVKC